MRLGRLAALLSAAVLAATTFVGSAAPAPVRAATIHNVPADFPTIQAAIDAAAPGDTVRVAPGEYVGPFTITKSLTLEGQDGQLADTVLNGQDNGWSILTIETEAAETVVVQGLTFFNGYHWQGDLDHGGAIFLTGTGTVTIAENVFESNTADGVGGAVYSGATGSVDIAANVFRFNHAAIGGGAIHLSNAGDVDVVNNLIHDNTAFAAGAIEAGGQSSVLGPTIRSNTIVNNTSSSPHSIRFHSNLEPIVFRNNIVVGTSSTTLISCSSTTSDPLFEGNDLRNEGTGTRITGCTDPTGTNGNVSVDPKLVDPIGYYDFHLRADSPLIDAGTADAGVTVDFEGDARPFDGNEAGGAQIDIGADEAIQPLLVDPAFLWFGTLWKGGQADLTVNVHNFAGAAVSITSATIAGPGVSEFDELSDTCAGATLAPQEGCAVQVRFSPTGVGIAEARLDITGPGSVGTVSVPMSGASNEPIQFSGTGFGEVKLGSSASRQLVLENIGDSAVTVTSAAIGGTHAADFTLTGQTCTAAPIPGGQTCTVNVTFTPSTLGVREAQVTLTGPSPVGTRNASLDGEGIPPTTPVSWGTTYKAGPAYTWNASNGLARTVQSGTQRLHLGYATDRVSGTWAKDSGPYAGIYYSRASSGSTWGTPKRVSPSTKHAIRFGIAASGSRVYVAYVTQTKLINFSGTAPRVLYVRRNTNHGSSTSWQTAIRLTSTTGRVDYPTIAATGYDVHVAWTNSNTGEIIVATSKDRGVTFTKRVIGTTGFSTSVGRVGVPSVAASGSTVAVTWMADSSGTLKTRVSTDRGSTWGTTETHTGESTGEFQTAVRGSRVAVAWTDYAGLNTRLRVAGGWQDIRLAVRESGSALRFPAIALQDTNRVGVSYAEDTATENWLALRWTESPNNGASWYGRQTLASTSTSTRRANDWPTVIWPSAGTRYVLWNGWTAFTNSYRLYLRKGTGTPPNLPAPTVAAIRTPGDDGISTATVREIAKLERGGARPPR